MSAKPRKPAGRTEVIGNELRIPTLTGNNLNHVRFNRNLAVIARELVPPELLIEFHMAVLQGHNPHIIRDARFTSGWHVTWEERGEMPPTLAEKTSSIKFLREAAYGMAAQSHYIEADVRSHASDSGVDTRMLANNPGMAYELVQALRTAMAAGQAGGTLQTLPEGSESESDEQAIDVQSEDVLDEPGVTSSEGH